ncbi:hypothetical protein EDEG_03338 [Edhazardia aedis USNM 41457]|uniref:Uncharacterized protein n=1 Tax=Edhazardia aedis (strain USNM 41457) TaxID=1003232 RepID=J9DHX5_EDHAE|nr:hypothetical protein EDEG_03338 [Edhazardia aedis USNM 41457]|eukprot:EJW02220.1 hypothetical protein EDEG_03338 [Edhazardia aedis USNM 41457]
MVDFQQSGLESLDEHLLTIAKNNHIKNYEEKYIPKESNKLENLHSQNLIIGVLHPILTNEDFKTLFRKENFEFKDLVVKKVECDESLEIKILCINNNETLQKILFVFNPFLRFFIYEESVHSSVPSFEIRIDEKKYCFDPKISDDMMNYLIFSTIGKEYFGENFVEGGSLKSKTVIKIFLKSFEEKDDISHDITKKRKEDFDTKCPLLDWIFFFLMIVTGYLVYKCISG